MPTRTKAPMSKPRSLALSRVAVLVLALASLTCSDDGGGLDGNGLISGEVYLAEPVVGATVTVNRWDGGVVGAEVCRATTDDAGHYACQSGKYFGIMLVTATGGNTTEQGAALTLPAGSVLRAPLLDLQPQQQRTIHLNPATELIVALGAARAAAGQDADLVASVNLAHARVRAHLDADPVTVAPKAIDAATAFDEAAKVSLVLRALGEAAHLAAVDQAVTVQAINTRALLDQLVRDAASAEARFDGNGTEVLSVGPACTLPTGCTVEGPGCYASCSVYVNTLRSRLAAASLSWLATPANRTGLTTSDVLTWATAVAANDDAELFAGDPPEPIDELGPEIVWTTPAAGQVFTGGTIMIDVTASDPLGVATLGVDHVVGQTRTPIADTDPAPGHFAGTLPLTPLLAEGTLHLEAHATDRDAHPSTSPRAVEINQLSGGAISGVAVKAALASAPVTVRTFVAGAPGPIVASGTTDPSGNFTNVAIPEGTQGSLLVEVGGAGTYAEDALPATVVSITATEKLSVVLPTYTDGDTVSGLVVSPATTLAVAYLTYLQSANQGGTDLAAKWTTATGAIERHLGVTGITTVVPSVPTQVDTLDDADRYGLVLLALSRTAWNASALGGGDAGAFGSAVNAMKVLQVWVRDLSDGCLDGKAGPTTPLTYGGTTPLTDEATRLHLAQALVAYLGGPQNQTQFSAAADVLPLLDTFATGGGNTAPGSCAGTNHLFDDNGQGFDREGPVVTWGAFPATDPYVRGSVTITATAVDNLPTLPGLVFTTGQTDIDIAMNGVRAVIDTTGMNGPVPLAVAATDGSGNSTPATHDLIADNLAPAISITAPAMDGLFLRPPVTLGWSVVEANPMATTATLDTTTPVTPGFQIAAEGAHSLSVTAVDRAGGTSTATRTFTIDSVAPVLTVTAPANGSYVRGPITLAWTVSDANPGTTATATLDGNPIVSGATTNDEVQHTLVVNAVDAAGNTAATVTRTFTVDNTPPVLTVTAISGFVRGPVTLAFSATDNFPPATVTATLDGTPILTGAQVSDPTAHTLVVNAVDQAGNAATAVTRTFTIDNTAPVLTSVSAPAGAVVKAPLTITVTGTDNLMAMGSLGPDITVTSTPAPSTTTPGTMGGNRTLAVTYTTLTDGAFTARFNLTDRAGNVATEHVVSRTIDGTAPTLSWSTAGLVPIGPAPNYWTGTATPTLTGNVADANLTTVIATWPGDMATATVAGGTWSLALPAAAGLGLAGLDVTITATDLAGNTTAMTRHLCADVTPPVVGFVDELIRNESKDSISFDAAPDAIYGKPKLNPSHTHSTTVANTTTLGPNVPCTLGTTPVTKYAYLLDETPLYGSHVNDPAVDGDNALRWTVAPSDDGVGLASMRYRVVNVATSAILLDWTTLPSTATTTVPLRRVGINSPSIPLLGTTQGLLRIEFEVTDGLNRVTTATRCWDQTLLAAPIYIGNATAPIADASGNAAGQYGLASLTLESTAPVMPVSMMLTPNAVGGAGLFEFPVYNPTNETVYLSIDLDLPSGATWSKSYYNNKWVYRDTTTSTVCSGVGTPGDWEPNYDLPGCGVGNPVGGTPGVQIASGTVPQADYGVRVWSVNQISTTLTELTQCSGCSSTPAAAQRTRITVQLPPRGTGANPPPPIEIQVLPVLRPSTNYQPAGTATEFNIGAFPLTGASTATLTKCLTWNLPIPYTGATQPSYRCTSTRNFSQVRFLKNLIVGGLPQLTAYAFTGLAGTTTSQPSHLMGAANAKSYFPPSPTWTTTETIEPPAL